MNDGWHYADNGVQRGPVDLNALSGLARQGRLTADTLVWRDGMAQWEAAGRTLPQLFAPVRAEPISPQRPLDYVTPGLEADAAPARLVEILRAARPWARFCGVFTLLGGSFCALITLILLIALATKPEEGVMVAAIFMAGISGLAIPAGVAMNRFASRASAAAASGRFADLETALDAQRGLWRLAGVLLIVGAAFMVLFIAFAAAVGNK